MPHIPSRSPYSPFFTSGLLSEPSSAVSSRSASPEVSLGPRRGSLPTDNHFTSPHAQKSPTTDDSSAFYFTLQPKRDKEQFRSFLSLDLAESHSLRSVSLRRKVSNLSKSTAWSSSPEGALFPKYSRIGKPSQRNDSPIRIHSSRESLRNIPSPKPAPSATLPALPSTSSLPPCLPPIPVTPPIRFSSLQRTSPSIVFSRTPAPTILTRSPSPKRTSTVSTRQRKTNRSDALACLEGRSQAARRILPRKRVERNFMCMSDDDDDEQEEEQEDNDGDDDSEVDGEGRVASGLLSKARANLRLVAEVEKDMMVPSSPRLTPSPKTRRSRRQRDSWFPLSSFMDLKDREEESWNWRSFIEIAIVS